MDSDFKKKMKYWSDARIRQRKKQMNKKVDYSSNKKPKYTKIKPVSKKMQEMHKIDQEFYREIWNSRAHYCENCNKYLGDEFENNGKPIALYRYSHIIPKSVYPFLRHYPKNIKLLCLQCHTNFDNLPKDQLPKMPCYSESEIEELKEYHKHLECNNDTRYK